VYLLIAEKLAEIYTSIEEKYYGLCDALSDKGIPADSYNSFLEEKGIPAFPFTLGIILFVILLFLWLVFIGGGVDTKIAFAIEDDTGKTLSGVRVVIRNSEGEFVKEQNIDSGEFIELEAVPLNSEFDVIATKEGFEGGETTIVIKESHESASLVLKRIINHTDARISIVDAETQDPVTSALVITEYKGESRQAIYDSEEKVYILSSIQEDDEILFKISANNYEELETQLSFSKDEVKTIEIYPKEIALAGKSSLLISVYDKDTKELIREAGIEIRDSKNDSLITSDTSIDGRYVADVEKGNSIRLIVSKEGYVNYDSYDTGESRTLRGEQETWDVYLEKGGTKLRVNVFSAGTGIPIEGAAVQLYNLDSVVVDENFSNYSGYTQFSGLKVGNEYFVTAYLDGYLPARAKVKPSEQNSITLNLESTSSSNSAILTITIYDSLYRAVSDARLEFYEKFGDLIMPLGIPMIKTSFGGYASITAPVDKTLLIKASKGVEQGEGEKFIERGIRNEMQIVLERIDSVKELVLLDEFGNPFAGDVKITDNTGRTLFDGNTEVDGSIIFDAKENERVNLTATGVDGNTFSEQVKLGGEDPTVVEVKKNKPSSLAPEIDLVGVLDSGGVEVQGITPDKDYWLKFEVNWTDSQYLGGVHIRIGNDSDSFVDSQEAGITGFDAEADSFVYGTSYHPTPSPGNESVDRQNRGRAGQLNKWLELSKKNPSDTQIIKVKVRARELAENTSFEVHYRAWGSFGGEYYRSPEDMDLGTRSFNQNKTGLYAKTFVETVKIFDSQPNCKGGVCASYKFFDSEGREIDVKEFNAKKGEVYALELTLNSDNSENLTVKAGTRSDQKISLTGYEIGGFGIPFDNESTDVSLNIPSFSVIKGSEKKLRIYFKAKQEGSSFIKTEIFANRGVIADSHYFNIYADKELSIKIIPDKITPGTDFEVSLQDAVSGKPVSNGSVEIYDAQGKHVDTLTRGKDGKYSVKNTYGPGEYAVKVKAPGYAEAEAGFRIEKEGLLEFPELIVINIDKKTKKAFVQKELLNSSEFAVENIGFKLTDKERLFEEFSLVIEPPESLLGNRTGLVSITAEFDGPEEASLMGVAELEISGLVEGEVPVSVNSKIQVFYNKEIPNECLKFDKEKLVAYLAGQAFTGSFEDYTNELSGNMTDYGSNEYQSTIEMLRDDPRFGIGQTTRRYDGEEAIELEIINECEIPLSLETLYHGSGGNEGIEIDMPREIDMDKGESKTITIRVRNRIERSFKNQEIVKFDIEFKSSEMSKDIPLDVILIDEYAVLSANQNIVIWLAKNPNEAEARAAVQIYIRNESMLEVTNVSFSLDDDLWTKNGISVNVLPGTIRNEVLAPKATMKPVRVIIAETSQDKSLDTPLLGKIFIDGIVNGQKRTLRSINVWIHVSGTSCLKLVPEEELSFVSKNASYGIDSKSIVVRNECAEEVRVNSVIVSSDIGENTFRLDGAGAVIPPRGEQKMQLKLVKRESMRREDVTVKLRGWLVRTQKSTESNQERVSIRLGEDSEPGPATESVTLDYCDEAGSIELKIPIISEKDCSKGYCDAKNMARFLAEKISEKAKQVKAKIGFLNSEAGGLCRNNNYCEFWELEVPSSRFYAYQQLDHMTGETLLHEIDEVGDKSITGYAVQTGRTDIGSVSSSGFGFKQIFLEKAMRGCGRYNLEISGAVQVIDGRILDDSFVIVIKEVNERQVTDECIERIENVLNFLPIDSGYSTKNDYGTWFGVVESADGLEELAKRFSSTLFGTDERVERVASRNKIKMLVGDVARGTIKLSLDETGQSNEAKTVNVYLNRALLEGEGGEEAGLLEKEFEKILLAEEEEAGAETTPAEAVSEEEKETVEEKEEPAPGMKEGTGEEEPATVGGEVIEETEAPTSTISPAESAREKLFEEAAGAIAALKQFSFDKGDACISKDGKSILISNYSTFDEPVIQSSKDSIRLYVTEHCMDLNVTGPIREKVKLKTDWPGRENKTGIEYVKLRLKPKTGEEEGKEIPMTVVGGEAVSISSYEMIEDKLGFPVLEFQLCVKGDDMFPMAVQSSEPFVNVKAMNDETGSNRLRQTDWKKIEFEVCGIHPYDLFNKLQTIKPGTYYATVGWKGEPDTVKTASILKAIVRYGDADNANKYLEIETGDGPDKELQSAFWKQVSGQRKKAAVAYLVGCVPVAAACGAITTGGWGALYDPLIDCVLPAAGIAFGETDQGEAVKEWVSEKWGWLKKTADSAVEQWGPTDPDKAEIAKDQAFYALTGVPAGQAIYKFNRSAGMPNFKEISSTVANQIVEAQAPNGGRLGTRQLRNMFSDAIEKKLRADPSLLTKAVPSNEIVNKAVKEATLEASTELGPELIALSKGTGFAGRGLAREPIAGSVGTTLNNQLDALANVDGITGSSYPMSSNYGTTLDEISGTIEDLKDALADTASKDLSNRMADEFDAGLTPAQRAQIPSNFKERIRRELQGDLHERLSAQIKETGESITLQVTEGPQGRIVDKQFPKYHIAADDAQTAAKNSMKKAVRNNTDVLGKLVSREVGEQFGQEILEKAEIPKTGRWKGLKTYFKTFFSRTFFKELGKGLICGALSNAAGYGAYNWWLKEDSANPANEEGLVMFNGIEGIELQKYHTYKFVVSKNYAKHVDMTEVKEKEQFEAMNKEIEKENEPAVRLDTDCSGEFLQHGIHAIFGSLNPADPENAKKVKNPERISIYTNPEIQGPLAEAAYKHEMEEALLVAGMFGVKSYEEADFPTAIEDLANVLSGFMKECNNDEKCALEKLAELAEGQADGREMYDTYKTWKNFKVDIEAYKTSALPSGLREGEPKNENSPGLSGTSGGNCSGIVEYAEQYLGCKYKPEGPTPVWLTPENCNNPGLTCATFVGSVISKYGWSGKTGNGREVCDTLIGAGYAVSISKEELQPGDIISTGTSGYGHVMMYYGNGQVIHSTSSAPSGSTGKNNEPRSSGVVLSSLEVKLSGKHAEYCRPKQCIGPTSSGTQVTGDFLVCIDAGHGDGSRAGQREPEVNLANAKALEAELQSRGIGTWMTRTGPTGDGLTSRVKRINEQNCTLIVSIHSDACSGACSDALLGIVGKDASDNPEPDRELCRLVMSSLANSTSYKNKGCKPEDYSNYDNLAIISNTNAPVTLIEIGEYGVQADKLVSSSSTSKVAKGLANGIEEFLKKKSPVNNGTGQQNAGGEDPGSSDWKNVSFLKITSQQSKVVSYVNRNFGSKFNNTGELFWKYGVQYGIDPGHGVATAVQESASGTSSLAVNCNNLFGLGYDGVSKYAETAGTCPSRTRFAKFDSAEDCIKVYFQKLKEQYVNHSPPQDTVAKMVAPSITSSCNLNYFCCAKAGGHCYCCDSTAGYESWVKNVSAIRSSLS